MHSILFCRAEETLPQRLCYSFKLIQAVPTVTPKVTSGKKLSQCRDSTRVQTKTLSVYAWKC